MILYQNFCVFLLVFMSTVASNQLYSKSKNCGLPTIPFARIIGGKNASQGAWPWHADLTYKGILYCGGTIINPTTIITAAHCVQYMDHQIIKVRVGAHKLKDSRYAQFYSITSYNIHENYNAHAYPNDIAIIKIDGIIQFERYVQPVCLPKKNKNIPIGSECYVTGWGFTDVLESKRPSVLQQLKVEIISNKDCQMKNGIFANITSDMVCVVKHDRADISTNRLICGGDSGGPLVCLDKHHRWELHGVVNWASPICDSSYSYSVFARVTYHRRWIQDNL